MSRKKINKDSSELTINKSDLKNKIIELEKVYKDSFKGNSCKEIMDAWYKFDAARKKYYKLSTNKSTEEQLVDEIVQMSSKDEYEL